jgi:cell division septation protein DedD
MAEGPTTTKEARVSRSARLPQVPIDRTLTLARAIHELASPSTPHRIAQRLHQSPSAGGFRTALGAAGYYGLIRQEGDRRALTELGARAIEEGEDAMSARRAAVALTGYRPILNAFRGREVNEAVISARIQDDFGLAAAPAGQVARALIEAGEQTALIVGGRFDAEAIENAVAAASGDGSRPAVTNPRPATPKTPRSETRDQGSQGPGPTPTPASQHAQRSAAPALHIDIQLHIPATATADQIDQIFASMAKHLYGRE